MSIRNSLAAWFLKKRIHQIELFLKYPHDVQNEWFEKLIDMAEDTAWGEKYDYKSLKSVEDFKSRVPINDYSSLQPYIERARKGEVSVLWPGEVPWFAKSSGTTSGKSKYIPVTEDSLEECHYQGGKDLLALYYIHYPESQVLAGKNIGVSGTTQLESDSDAFTGDLSAILIDNMPFWAQMACTPDLSVSMMDNWENKLDLIVKHTLVEDVRTLSGVPSWMLVILRRVLEASGKSNISEVWPNFELVIHGGVNFKPYRQQFEDILPKHTHYLETYNASEGFFGIQDQVGQSDMLLMLDYGIYYEFLPMGELDKDFPKSLSLDEVELGVNYALVISTNGGLWRYLIGDTIVFTSKYPYRIRITGRTKSFINAVGEELIVENADYAIEVACSKTNSVISEYTVAPIYFNGKQNATHQWALEFEKQPQDIAMFMDILDNALKSKNSDYEAKRYHDIILRPPEIKVLERGSFMAWLKQNNKLGGQNKIPRLSNDRDFVEELFQINSIR